MATPSESADDRKAPEALDGLGGLPTASIKTIRRLSVQVLYQLDYQAAQVLSDEAFQAFIAQNDVPQDLEPWLRVFASLAHEESRRCDTWIKSLSQNWNISRMGKVEVAILRVCLAELLNRGGVTPATVIADAAEIAKEFGTERSQAFVHGILDAVYKDKILPATKGNPSL
jgi:N utilization substance protein B